MPVYPFLFDFENAPFVNLVTKSYYVLFFDYVDLIDNRMFPACNESLIERVDRLFHDCANVFDRFTRRILTFLKKIGREAFDAFLDLVDDAALRKGAVAGFQLGASATYSALASILGVSVLPSLGWGLVLAGGALAACLGYK